MIVNQMAQSPTTCDKNGANTIALKKIGGGLQYRLGNLAERYWKREPENINFFVSVIANPSAVRIFPESTV